jgi:hypothetical protein
MHKKTKEKSVKSFFEICVIRDFWTYPEISQKSLDRIYGEFIIRNSISQYEITKFASNQDPGLLILRWKVIIRL